jgi:hypothetical protein
MLTNIESRDIFYNTLLKDNDDKFSSRFKAYFLC